jgi:hypothetical protein
MAIDAMVGKSLDMQTSTGGKGLDMQISINRWQGLA